MQQTTTPKIECITIAKAASFNPIKNHPTVIAIEDFFYLKFWWTKVFVD